MTTMKRLTALLTAAAAAASLAACSSYNDGAEAEDIAGARENVRHDIDLADASDDPIVEGGQDDDIPIGVVIPDDRLTPPKPIDDEFEERYREDDAFMDKKFTDAAFDLSAELFKRSCADALGSGENAMISPWSVMQALGLAANGADGETLAQFEALLGCGMELDEINRALSSMIADAKAAEDVKLGIANSVWVDTRYGFSMKKSYMNTCLEKLDAESFALPLDQSAADKLNGWVSEKTDDMIQKLIDSFDPNDRAVLVNCLVFKGEWGSEYDDSRIDENAVFTNASGEKEDCTLLASTEGKYISGYGATGFIKPYKGGRYAFAALLPDVDSSLTEFACSLNGSKLSALLNSASDAYEVQAYIPEFKFDFGKSIKQELSAMGIDKAFGDEADFSCMSDEKLCIGDVIHKTYIELDRTGTKAAAATGVMVRAMSLAPVKQMVTVKLDRPFMFAIVDTENGLPVFIGAVNSVK